MDISRFDMISNAMAPILQDCLLKSTTLLAVALVAMPALRGKSAGVRHAVLTIAICGVILLPALRAALPGWRITLPAAPVRIAPPPPSYSMPAAPELDGGTNNDSATRADSEAAPMATRAPLVHESVPLNASPDARPIDWPLALLVTWAVGAAMMAARIVVQFRRLGGLARRAKPIAYTDTLAPELANILDSVRVMLLEAAESDGPLTPLTWSAARPVILLPSGWRSWPTEQIKSVLLHEIGHIRRHDWPIQMLSLVARALHWPNPLVWAVTQRLRHESEMACDDSVLLSGIRASDYAAHLLSIAQRTTRACRPTAMALAMARTTRIERRLTSILNPARPRRPIRRITAVTLSGLLLATVVPLTALRVGASPGGSPTASPEPLWPRQTESASIESGPVVSAPHALPSFGPVNPTVSTIEAPRPSSDLRTAVPSSVNGEATILNETAWGKAVNGLQAGIRLDGDRRTIRIGERVKFAVVIRNVSDHNVDIAFANVQRIHGWRAKRQADGSYVIAPRSRYPREEKIELEVAGAISFRIEAGHQVDVPVDNPDCVVSANDGDAPKKMVLTGAPGSQIHVSCLPLDCIARGEEWIEQLQTGSVAITVAKASVAPAGSSNIQWGPAVDGIQAGVRLEKPTNRYAVGEPIWQEVYIRNRGTQPITFNRLIGFEEQGQAEVTEPGGNPIHVQQFYGIGGLALGAGSRVGPGEIVMIGRHSLAFTGGPIEESEKEPAPGISMSAYGLPRAYAGPGRYLVRQLASGTVGSNNKSLRTGPIEMEITPQDANAGPGGGIPVGRTNAIPDLKTAQVAWGKPVHGLEVGLLFLSGKSHYASGEKVRVAMVVRNVSAKTISFWHQVAFGAVPDPIVRDDRGRAVRVSAIPETEWRPLGEMGMTGVTLDMTSAPSAGGPPRTRESEIGPGRSTIGYSLSSIIAPRGGRSFTVEQQLAVGFSGSGELDTLISTGRLPMEVFSAESAQSSNRIVSPPQSAPTIPGVAWGAVSNGLQAGIRFQDNRAPRSTGEQLWMDLFVRNVSSSDVTVAYKTGSVYIDPPARVFSRRGACQVVGGNFQIVNPFSRTLKPGESVLIGHPNYITMPRAPIESTGMTTYPELHIEPGSYRIEQDFPVEAGGRGITLSSGNLAFQIAEHTQPIAWGPSAGGVQAGLGFQQDRGRYKIGETAGFYVYLRNTGKAPAAITYHTNGEPLTLQGKNANGEPLTINQMRPSIYPHEQSIKLNPGQMIIVSAPNVEITDKYKQAGVAASVLIAEPGRYTFGCERISNYVENGAPPANGEIPTGQLPIEIVRS